jgi:hypothetical protein
LGVGSVRMVLSIIGINLVLFLVLFFFTTPLAMLGGLQQWEEGAAFFERVENWIASSSVLGPFVVGYLPSLIMLGLTSLLPHIIYCM